MTDKSIETFLAEVKPLNPDYIMRAYFKQDGRDFKPTLLRNYVTKLRERLPSTAVGFCMSSGIIGLDFVWPNGRAVSQAEMDSMVLRGPKGETVDFGYSGLRKVADATKTAYQQFLLLWAKALLEAGADVVDYDGAYNGAYVRVVNWKQDKQAVLTAWDQAWKNIYSQTWQLGAKYVSLHSGTPEVVATYNHFPPHQDLAYLNIPAKAVAAFSFGDVDQWKTTVSLAADKQVLAFLDWDYSANSALAIFASYSPQDQSRYLQLAKETSRGIGSGFIYPVHGGYLGPDRGYYDSVQYGTYNTIKLLMQQSIVTSSSVTTSKTSFTSLTTRTTTASPTLIPTYIRATWKATGVATAIIYGRLETERGSGLGGKYVTVLEKGKPSSDAVEVLTGTGGYFSVNYCKMRATYIITFAGDSRYASCSIETTLSP